MSGAVSKFGYYGKNGKVTIDQDTLNYIDSRIDQTTEVGIKRVKLSDDGAVPSSSIVSLIASSEEDAPDFRLRTITGGAGISVSQLDEGEFKSILLSAPGLVGYTKPEVDAKIATVNDTIVTGDNYLAIAIDSKPSFQYVADLVNAAVALKANSAEVYTAVQVDIALSNKVNLNVYESDIAFIGNALDLKANSTDVYTTGQVDTKLNLKADTTALDSAVQTNVSQAASIQELYSEVTLKASTSSVLAGYAELNNSKVSNTDFASALNIVSNAIGTKVDRSDTYTITQVNNALNFKADKVDTYTIDQVNSINSFKANQEDLISGLASKADQKTTYTKIQADDLLFLKAAKADVYEKSEVNVLLSEKADANSVYTKLESDSNFVPINDSSILNVRYPPRNVTFTNGNTASVFFNNATGGTSISTAQTGTSRFAFSIGTNVGLIQPSWVGTKICRVTFLLNAIYSNGANDVPLACWFQNCGITATPTTPLFALASNPSLAYGHTVATVRSQANSTFSATYDAILPLIGGNFYGIAMSTSGTGITYSVFANVNIQSLNAIL